MEDIVQLYKKMLHAFVTDQDIPHGRASGFYFSATGMIKWRDLYQGIATALKEQGHIPDDTLGNPTQDDRLRLSSILQEKGEFVGAVDLGTDARFVDFSMAGRYVNSGTYTISMLTVTV